MKPSLRPLFLERQSYRGRRAIDMARLLPILGAFLFVLPLLRPGAGLAGQLFYIFLVWPLLIVLAALLARRLCQVSGDSAEAPESDEGAP